VRSKAKAQIDEEVSQRSVAMKTYRNRWLTIVVAGLIAVGGVSRVAAQNGSILRGSFTLPCDVSWQGDLLPAGAYTFSLQSGVLPALVSVRGPQGIIFIQASALNETQTHQQSALTLERRGSTSFVREMYLDDLGLHIFYRVPKVPKNEKQLAQGPVATEQVVVALRK
jgi:hypothetical protein